MARPLTVVPDRPLRAIGVIRVSAKMGRDDDEFMSPEIQRTAITDAALRRGYQIVDWVEGIDESGSKTRSPWWAKLDATIARIERGEADVALVWKFSRAARHRVKFAVAIDRVEAVGGRLESATEDFDVTTATGRLGRGMVNELSVFQAELIGEGWKETHAARVRAGKPHSGGPRFGYVYDREQKLHVPDPETGPVLADLYARYTAGEALHGLVLWLNAHGYPTAVGGKWCTTSLRAMLDAGFGAGYFRAGGDPKRKIPPTLHRGVHVPVVDEATWQAYLDARQARRSVAPRSQSSKYVLSGLIICGECGGNLGAGRPGKKGGGAHVLFRCLRHNAYGPAVCTMNRYVRSDYLEEQLLEWLGGVAAEVEGEAVHARVAEARRVTAASEAARFQREAARVEAEITRLALQHVRTPLPEVAYDSAVEELSAQLRELRMLAEDAARDARTAVSDPPAVAAGLLENWYKMPVEHRREVLRGLLVGLVALPVAPGTRGFRVVPVPEWDRRV